MDYTSNSNIARVLTFNFEVIYVYPLHSITKNDIFSADFLVSIVVVI